MMCSMLECMLLRASAAVLISECCSYEMVFCTRLVMTCAPAAGTSDHAMHDPTTCENTSTHEATRRLRGTKKIVCGLAASHDGSTSFPRRKSTSVVMRNQCLQTDFYAKTWLKISRWIYSKHGWGTLSQE